MRRTDTIHEAAGFRFRLRHWTCCGQVWELLLSRRYPERETWQPVCDKCNKRDEEEHDQ